MDDEGREVMAFREIIDHEVSDEAETNHQPGTKTTRGWQIQVEMADDSTHWLPLRDTKEASPVKMAEYAGENAEQLRRTQGTISWTSIKAILQGTSITTQA